MKSPFRFTLVAHSLEIVDCVSAVARDDPEVELRSFVVNSDSLVSMARKYLEQGEEVILCHGGTGNAIVKAIGASAVAISRTDLDVIKTLSRAKLQSHDIGIATHPDEYRDTDALQELLNIRLFPISYTTWEEQVTRVDALYAKGIRVLVGGGTSVYRMQERGGTGLVVIPNVHSIREAIQRAKTVARQKRADTRHLDELQAIFGHLRDGVVCMDGSGSLLFVNRIAEQILDLGEGSPEFLWTQVFEKLLLKSVLSDLETRREEMVSFKNRQLVVTASPLLVKSGLSGAVAVFSDVSSVQKIHRKISESRFSKSMEARYFVKDIKGSTPEMAQLREYVKRFSSTGAAVHVTGETGTGKERVAHAVHSSSKRHKAPFVAANISTLPESLIESELFGYEEGAFTGAKRGGKPGLLEIANKGTLFLDEIGDLSLTLQLRLLRVLESKEVMRIGASDFLPVDVRIVSATHHSLIELVRQGKFRLDLYFRLTTLVLKIPPLRDRKQDIRLLSQDTLANHGFAKDHLSEVMLEKLSAYHWPGNVRELLALLERYCALNESKARDEALLGELLVKQRRLMMSTENTSFFVDPQRLLGRAGEPPRSLKEEMDRIRREIIRKSIEYYNGDRQRAAKELGMSYTTLWRDLREDEAENPQKSISAPDGLSSN